MSNDNFFSTLKRGFNAALNKPFLTFPDGAGITYGEIDDASACMAGALLRAGAAPGDRILVQVEKSAANIALYLGAMRAGLIYVPLNTGYTPEETAYFLDDAKPSIFVCGEQRKMQMAGQANTVVFTLDGDGNGSLSESARNVETPYSSIHPRHKDDLAAILYTSGTTGRSKGAMLTHENLQSNAIALNRLWDVSRNDMLIHMLPTYHVHGLFVAIHTLMLSGAKILFFPAFDVDAAKTAMKKATMMMGVPTFYSRLLADESFGGADAQSMRVFISGSAPLRDETFTAFERRTGHRILERYGMSETGMIASNPLDGDRVAGTVGFPLPDVEVRITGGGEIDAGETGSVEVRGPNVFKGYWRLPEKTGESFTADGFFRTGDVGAIDHSGRLSLIGRSKDLIIAGGLNIYPKEIELFLDGVNGVTESAVIGSPHPDMGEGVVAILVADQKIVPANDLDRALTGLAKFKRPRKFFWIDALPRNAMGKVQKQVLRARYVGAFS